MMKKTLVSSPSSGLFRMYPSINNIFMLGVVLFSVFLIYRYVKSLEKEVKMLADKINTIQYKPQYVEPMMTPDDIKNTEYESNRMCKRSDMSGGDECTAISNTDDDESVKSEDIMRMINDIQNADEERDDIIDENKPNEVSSENEQKHSSGDGDEQQSLDITSGEKNEETVLEDDFVIKKSSSSESSVLDIDDLTEETLLKKTNEELRKILKDQGKNTKGLKNDLIKRILEE